MVEISEMGYVGCCGRICSRIVATKILSDSLAWDPQFRTRFEHDARTIAALSHPHICTLYDVGHHDVTDFLVMEHLEGHAGERGYSVVGPTTRRHVAGHGIQMA